MKIYADTTAMFVRQLLADFLFVCWVIAWIWIGNTVHDGTLALAGAGRVEVEAVEDLAFWLGLSIAAIPILLVGSRHLPGRVRFVREATACQRFVDGAEDLDLFALRALTRQPMHVLARISGDPAGAWRARDPEIMTRLAALELEANGLQPPRPARA